MCKCSETVVCDECLNDSFYGETVLEDAEQEIIDSIDYSDDQSLYEMMVEDCY